MNGAPDQEQPDSDLHELTEAVNDIFHEMPTVPEMYPDPDNLPAAVQRALDDPDSFKLVQHFTREREAANYRQLKSVEKHQVRGGKRLAGIIGVRFGDEGQEYSHDHVMFVVYEP